jgi:acyl carrier protein
MGMDVLEIVFRVEDEFGVTLTPEDFDEVCQRPSALRSDFRAGDVQFLIGCRLREAGRPVPEDIWERVRSILATITGVERDRVRPESWVVHELGAT